MNYNNILKEGNIKTIKYFIKELKTDIRLSETVAKHSKREIKRKQKDLDKFELKTQNKIKNLELLKNTLKDINIKNNLKNKNHAN